jgi:hypothetical protein
MKYSLDFCKIQWLNREFLPMNYAFKYSKNESRFINIFNTLKKLSSSNIENEIYEMKSMKQNKRTSDINIYKILTLEERRTTLMIKNVPNKFTNDIFLSIFNKEFEDKFDLFLLPTDIKEKKNYGYAFINFINPLDIIYFFYRFNGKKWPNTNSVKICEIVFSKIQGINKMIKHYHIKVMYQKIMMKNEEENKKDIDIYLKDKKDIVIPIVFLNEFNIIYPNSNFKFDINIKDIILVDKNVFNSKNLGNY